MSSRCHTAEVMETRTLGQHCSRSHPGSPGRSPGRKRPRFRSDETCSQTTRSTVQRADPGRGRPPLDSVARRTPPASCGTSPAGCRAQPTLARFPRARSLGSDPRPGASLASLAANTGCCGPRTGPTRPPTGAGSTPGFACHARRRREHGRPPSRAARGPEPGGSGPAARRAWTWSSSVRRWSRQRPRPSDQRRPFGGQTVGEHAAVGVTDHVDSVLVDPEPGGQLRDHLGEEAHVVDAVLQRIPTTVARVPVPEVSEQTGTVREGDHEAPRGRQVRSARCLPSIVRASENAP